MTSWIYFDIVGGVSVSLASGFGWEVAIVELHVGCRLSLAD